MHNKLLVLEKTITLRKRRKLYRWQLYFFSFFLGLVMCHKSQTWSLMIVEKMYVVYFMHIDLSNSLHLTIRSSLILIQNKLWVPKYCHTHFYIFIFIFRVSQKCHQDFNLLHAYYTYYISLFCVKSNEKWFTLCSWPPSACELVTHLFYLSKPFFCNSIEISKQKSNQNSIPKPHTEVLKFTKSLPKLNFQWKK